MKEALRVDEGDYVTLAPEDAVEIVDEDDAGETFSPEERLEMQQALFEYNQAEKTKKPRRIEGPDARRVRAPRFSDAEYARAELVARRLLSVTNSRKGPRPMSGHEFIRESTMIVTALVEQVRTEGLLTLAGVFAAAGALHPAALRKAQEDASTTGVPLWDGAKLTTADLELRLEWQKLPRPTGEVPPELLHAQRTEHRSRDLDWCPVEKAVLRISEKGRRRPPRYNSECVICEWPHALPVDWPVDDAGAELDEKQRARLEEARSAQRAKAEEKPPACALCDDTGKHQIDDTRCRCRDAEVVCGMCDDTGFYSAGSSLHPCNCTTGRNLVAKGHPDTNKIYAKLSKAARRKAQQVALAAVAGTRIDPRQRGPQTGAAASRRLTLKDKGFAKGTAGICYLCDEPAAPEPAGELSDRAYDDAVITDWIGVVHQRCFDDMPESLAARFDRLQAKAERAAGPARLTLADKGFTKGAPDICYVCNLPCGPENVRGGWTQDRLGRAHNSCLCALSTELTKKRDGFLGRGRALPSSEKKRATKKKAKKKRSSCPPRFLR